MQCRLVKLLAEEERTIVLYESTYRIEKLLNELSEFMPKRLYIQRELTKKFEESWRGFPSKFLMISNKITKGEFVVIISPLSGLTNYLFTNNDILFIP